jgi:3-deoxy-D-manno-octulosonic-acid transferase
MQILYNFLTRISYVFLWGAQFFSKKMKLFIDGRKNVISTLQNKISITDKTIWFHCASLGEFEQGLPIMEAIKKLLPDYKIVVTFFSPSGYEIKKKSPIADLIVYLPIDTKYNAQKFVEFAHPSLAIFVKYEFWPNYLLELKKNNIPTLLVSGLFRADQLFFKPYGSFMRKALYSLDYLFVQNEASQELLKKINITHSIVSGDTRFDRVSHQIEQDNSLNFMKIFIGDSLCIVCGSTWPEDESVLLDYINTVSLAVKFVIAPHKIDVSKIESFRKKLKKSSVLYSEISSTKSLKNTDLSEYSVLIIDTIGLLTKIYSYADIAYVGGAMGTTGLHNILEPATFGVPIVTGENFEKFPEAIRLQQLAGLFSVSNSDECIQILTKLVADKSFRSKTGMIAGHFINSNTGATQKIMNYIEDLHRNGTI